MLSTLLCLALCAPSDPATVQAAELTTRMFDLAPILEPRAATPTAIRLLPALVNPRGSDVFEEFEPTALAADSVVDLVRNCVWQDEWEFEGRSLDLVMTETGTFMRVTLPAARMVDVANFLQFLTQTLNAATVVTVDVHRVRTTGQGQPTIPADAAGVAELVADGRLGPARTFTLRLKPGRVEHSALLQSHTYVSHFEVEIAQAAARPNPITRTLETGTSLSMRGDVMQDGRVALQYALSDSAIPTAFDSIELKTEAQFVSERGSETSSARCVIQSPTLRFATLAGTAELERGKSIVVGAIDPTATATDHAGIVVVLRADEIAARSDVFPIGDRELRILNVGYSALSALRIPAATRAQLQWTTDPASEPQAFVDLVREPDHSLVEAATYASGAFDSGEVYVMAQGPFVFLRTATAPAQARDLGADIEARLRAALPQVPASTLVDLQIGEGTNARVCGRVSCSNRGALALAGTQENYVASWEVDVANNSSIAQPITFMLPSAFAARVTSAPTVEASRSVRLQFLSQFRSGPKTVIDPQMPLLGISHAREFLTTSFDATRWLGVLDAIPFGMVELWPGRTDPVIAVLH